MSKSSYNKLTPSELEYVDDKTAALLLNTPNNARLMLWVMVILFYPRRRVVILGSNRQSNGRSG